MGNILTNWAKGQSAGSGGAKAVLLCLCDTAKDYERGRVEITQQQIADIIEFDKRSVMRWLDKLEGKLVTRRKTKKADGTNNPNVYQILCPAEIFLPSDTESPSEPDIVTESHLEILQEEVQGDTQSLPNEEITPESVEIEPTQVTDSHLELSDTQSPFTVLEEEELLDKRDSNESLVEMPKKKLRKFTACEKAERLFKFWQKKMNSKRSVFSDKRKTKIKAVLKKVSYSDCMRAIIGCANSDWHMGRDKDNQTLYNEFERIFKDVEETEKFINRYFKQLIGRQLKQNGTIQPNGNGNYQEQRAQRAINGRNTIEEARAHAERRRLAKLQNSGFANR